MGAILTRRRRFRLQWGVIAAFAMSMPCLASHAPPALPASKNVLVISEVGITHRAAAVVTQALMSSLSANRDYQVEFYLESLNTTAFANPASQQEAEDALLQKYKDLKVDVIVVMGPRPIAFASHFPRTFFPDAPVVFGGSSREQAGNPHLDSRFTGSWMEFEPTKTLDAALKLLPKTRHVVVVGGSSTFDKGLEAATRRALDHYAERLDVSYLTDLSMTDVRERIRHLPSGTVILYTSFFRDAAGNEFLNATTALPMISEAAEVPVFGISDTYLGNGIVGGSVLSFSEQGKIASRLVLEILRGAKPGDIPIQISPSVYMFDWKQLQRWGLSELDLPPGSIVLFRELSLWQRAKWIVVATVLVILGLAFLTAYLLFNRKQLRLARDEQIRLSGMLINAQEEERKRLAAELHDDFSQRLALLSLGLETAAELVSESPREANEQLQELINSASELGADLHAISHTLHSSTLERLGLVPGIGAFCKEFSSQQGIRVGFTHRGESDRMSSDVALCLFRIVQEGLRNVKKHSGALEAQVELEHLDGCLHLSVSDDGAGFDAKDAANKQGLGLFSMQERARLIGARFEIHSEPENGTRIDVWVSHPPQAKSELPDVVDQPAVYQTQIVVGGR